MKKAVYPGRVEGSLTPPCSKSYAQRALAAALLADGRSRLENIEFCDDTLASLHTIEALGAQIVDRSEGTICIVGGFNPRSRRLDVTESGLAMRLFAPVAALWNQTVTIDGRGTLLSRPVSMMYEPFRQLGVDFRADHGHVPIEVTGPCRGNEVTLDGSLSSQFLTGLLLALPARGEEATVRVENPVSTPYIDITIDTARRFGVDILHTEGDYTEFFIPAGQHYRPAVFPIESDWSAAAILLVAGAIAGRVTVFHLSTLSLQADRSVLEALERAGARLEIEHDSVTASQSELRAFHFDATQSPDLFPALVALAAAAEGVSEIEGVRRLLHKESDRAAALVEEYGRLGIEVGIDGDRMYVRGGRVSAATVDGHGDHRIVMSLAVTALRADGPVTIEGAESVSKSNPTFFNDLELLRR